MYNLFCSFFQQTQSSIISKNFHNIIKQEIKCPNCSNLYFYLYRHVIKFEIDKYKKFRNQVEPQKTSTNLSLEDCFECYTGGTVKKCNSCKQPNSKFYTSIVTNSKILIIALVRNTHVFKCDVDFTNKLDIFKYCDIKNKNNKNTNYNINNNFINDISHYNKIKLPINKSSRLQNLLSDIKNKNSTSYNLRACISLNNLGQYFADIFTNNYWFRYYGNQVSMLGNVNEEIHFYEPQILIYELE